MQGSLQPLSNRAQEDARLLRLIRAAFVASHGIYGAPRVFLDLREAGETCSKHCVARLMRENKLRALNQSRLDDIQSLANEGYVADEAVQRWLDKDDDLVTARSLDDWEPI